MQQLDWDIRDFRSWLLTHTPIETAGYSDSLTNCPIARWRRYTGERVSLSAEIIVFLDGGRECPTPEWVEQFIETLDERHADEEGDDFSYRTEEVTAKECMDVVDIIIGVA